VQQKIPPCSVARSNEDNKKNPVTSRLGDAFAASEENTQECKQS
jgi:hypothetical protein